MNRRLMLAAGLAAAVATPALAAIAVGQKAPDFKASAYHNAKPVSFDLAAARKQGPVVLYFFPAVDTPGCNLEAKLFAENIEAFKKQGATVVGISSGNLDKLKTWSADTATCSGKFPVAADPGAKIADQYGVRIAPGRDMSNRTSFVIAPDGKVVHVHSAMAAPGHIEQSLKAVTAWKAKR